MAGPTERPSDGQLVERKGDGGSLSVSVFVCHTHPPTSEKMEKFFEVLVFLLASAHSIQLAFLLPDRAATKGGSEEDEPSEPRVRQQEIPSSADSAPALPPLLSPAVCYLNSSRPSGAASSDRDAVWNFDRITNEHRRGEERRGERERSTRDFLSLTIISEFHRRHSTSFPDSRPLVSRIEPPSGGCGRKSREGEVPRMADGRNSAKSMILS